jgi:RND superfamily putative drug exporter
VLAVAIIVIAAIGIASQAAGGSFVDSFSIPGAESQKTWNLPGERFPSVSGDSAIVAIKADGALDSPVNRTRVHFEARPVTKRTI